MILHEQSSWFSQLHGISEFEGCPGRIKQSKRRRKKKQGMNKYSIVLEISVSKTLGLRNLSYQGAVTNDSNHFSILASKPEGPIREGRSQRCRSQDNACTEFLICSLSPTHAIDVKYIIAWPSSLLVSIPKCLVGITFWHLNLVRKRGLDIHC